MGRYVHENMAVNAMHLHREPIGHIVEAFPDGAAVEVEAVVVRQTALADARWNVYLGGDHLFDTGAGRASEVNVTQADESQRFVPNANLANKTNSTNTTNIAVRVKNASAAGPPHSQLEVTVLTKDNRD